MTKPQIKRDIIANLRRDLDGSLDDAIALLQRHKAEAEAKGYTALGIDIDAYEEYGSPIVSVELYGKRLETADEAKARDEAERRYNDLAEARARQQYEALKGQVRGLIHPYGHEWRCEMSTPQMMRMNVADIREELSGNIDEVISKLQELKAEFEGKGFSSLEIDVDTYYEYGDTYVKAVLEGSRMETQGEADAREACEKQRIAARDAQARAQYEALKAKFG